MKKVFIIGFVLSITLTVYCQQGHKLKPQESVPILLEMPTPLYPESAKKQKIEGTVYLQIQVDKDGGVKKISIFKSDAQIFDSSAINAMRNAKFRPATKNGISIEESIILPVAFSLQSDIEKQIASAESLMKEKKYQSAIDLLNKVISEDPRNGIAYKLRGDSYNKLAKYYNAKFDYRRAISLERKNPTRKLKVEEELNEMLIKWYAKLNNEIRVLQNALVEDSDKPGIYLQIGKLYMSMELWKNAEEWYDKFLTRDDKATPDEIIRYTEILAKTGGLNKGKKILTTYTGKFPEDWRLWSRFGYFSSWTGDYENARRAFEIALKYKPFFKEAQDGLDLVNHQFTKP